MKSAIWTLGRFNPPTAGHELMITEVLQIARDTRSQMNIFTTMSNDSSRNPLNPTQKMKFLRAGFPGIPFTTVNNLYESLYMMEDRNYDHVTIVAGSDRMSDYIKLFTEAKNKGKISYTFDWVGLKRYSDVKSITGTSSSYARSLVENDQMDDFKNTCPVNMADATREQMFEAIRTGLGR